MSGSQWGMRAPPPAPQPTVGQRIPPDQFTYIPGQERSFGHQPNVNNQYLHPNASPLFPGGDSGPRGSFPPHPPHPPDHRNLPPPPHLGNPPPMFSRPPPLPSTFPHACQNHPPPMPHTPNIPYQAAFHTPPVMTPQNGSSIWQLHAPPAVLPCPQLQVNPGQSVTHPVSSEGTADMARQKEEEDSKWLGEFEKRVESCSPPPPPTESITTTTTTSRKNIKLAEVQRLVVESFSLKQQLCGLEKDLTVVREEAEEEEWERLVQQAEAVKARLKETQEYFEDQGFIEHTKMLVRQRRTKRTRVKRRKKEIKLEKEELKKKREEEEAMIDAWRAKLQREEDARRREEAVKREADSVLGEVRQKQTEAQRMTQLLAALAGLRTTRGTQAMAQGTPRDTQAEHRFTATTKMMVDILKKQQKEYELEEQTLRVMLEESVGHRSAALAAKRDANFARYEDSIRRLIFGPTATADVPEDAGLALETLVQRRHEWDQYVVAGASPLASAVPLPWVLPPAQPEPPWAAFLKR